MLILVMKKGGYDVNWRKVITGVSIAVISIFAMLFWAIFHLEQMIMEDMRDARYELVK